MPLHTVTNGALLPPDAATAKETESVLFRRAQDRRARGNRGSSWDCDPLCTLGPSCKHAGYSVHNASVLVPHKRINKGPSS